MAQLSEYEKQRQRNIDANQVVLNSRGLGDSNSNKFKPSEQQPKPKKRKKDAADVSLVPVRSGERARTQRKFDSYAGLDGGSGTGASYGSRRKVREDSSESEESDYSVDEDADEVEAFRKRKRTTGKVPRDNGRRETGRCGPRMRDMLAAKAPRRAPSLRPPTVSSSALLRPPMCAFAGLDAIRLDAACRTVFCPKCGPPLRKGALLGGVLAGGGWTRGTLPRDGGGPPQSPDAVQRRAMELWWCTTRVVQGVADHNTEAGPAVVATGGRVGTQ